MTDGLSDGLMPTRTKEDAYKDIEKCTGLLEERKRQICMNMDAMDVLNLQVDIGNLILFIEFKTKELREMEL